MTRSQSNKHRLLMLVSVLFFIFSTSRVFAFQLFNLGPCNFCPTWRGVAAIGGGLAIANDSDLSKTFPIINPVTDQFFIYRSGDNHRTEGFFDVFLGAEVNLACFPEWSLQVGLGYNETTHFHVRGTFLQGADELSEDQFNYRFNTLARQILAEAKLLYNIQCACYRPYHPYVLVGLGASFNRAEHFRTNVPPFLTFTREFDNHRETSFSYAVGLGIDVDVTPCLRFGLGYRFTDFGRVRLGRATIDDVPVQGTLSRPHFYAHEILAQLTYLF
jgi:hypothetical protein